MKKYLWSIPFIFISIWGIAEMVSLGGFLNVVSEVDSNSGAPSLTGVLLDATGEKYAVSFPVVGTKTFRRFGFRLNTITTGDTLDLRLELSGQGQATGIPPSGTLACANSSTTLTLTTGQSNSYVESSNLASDCTVTNSTVAVVINNVLGNFNGSFAILQLGRDDYNVFYSSGSSAGWASSNVVPVLTAIDNNSNYINLLGMVAVSNITATSFNSTTNPNTRGNLINLPFDHRIIGAKYNATVAQPLILKLWDTDGATVLESVYISSGVSVLANTKGFVTFSKGYIMHANQAYRLTFSPVTTTNSAFYHYNWPNQTIMDQLVPFGPYIYISTGNNPTQESSWTQQTTARATLYPIIDQIGITSGQNTFYDSTLYDTTIK